MKKKENLFNDFPFFMTTKELLQRIYQDAVHNSYQDTPFHEALSVYRESFQLLLHKKPKVKLTKLLMFFSLSFFLEQNSKTHN